MPTIQCPHCGRDIQYPESFAGGSVGCPAAGCGRCVQLPNLDGTFPTKVVGPVPPPLPAGPRRSDKYYLRKQLDLSVVVGPLPRDRIGELIYEGKVRADDELSADWKKWWPAIRVEPEFFGRAPGQCRTCGARVAPGETDCADCR